jgi:hypothetical protein
MNRTSLSAAVLTAALFATFVSSVYAAETPSRYQVRAESRQTQDVQVTKSGSTWFEGTTADGQRVTVVFQPRFATVKRGGNRVPVSYLRADDRVEVSGHVSGRRLHANSAEQKPAQTAAVQLTSAGATASSCCTEACGDDCSACCTAHGAAAPSVTAPSPKDGYRVPPAGAQARAMACCATPAHGCCP